MYILENSLYFNNSLKAPANAKTYNKLFLKYRKNKIYSCIEDSIKIK